MFVKCLFVFALVVTSALAVCNFKGPPCKENQAEFILTESCKRECYNVYPLGRNCNKKCNYNRVPCLSKQLEVLDNCTCTRRCVTFLEKDQKCSNKDQLLMCGKPLKCVNYKCTKL